jgi:hypothetical protein
LLYQEAELAELQHEAKAIIQLIAKVQRRAKEAAAASAAATSTTLAQALKAAEATRQEGYGRRQLKRPSW